MKIDIVRPEFMKAWQMAERSSSTRSTVASLGGVLVVAEGDRVLLEATDLKTSIRCLAGGISVSEDGTAILPVKLLGELFKKASSDILKIEIKGEKGVLSAGRNRTRFTTWVASDFPKLPHFDSAEPLCDISAPELLRAISEGSIASSATDDFPKYLGACLLRVGKGRFQVVSTDGRRLSLSKCPCDAKSDAELLLPLVALRELQRLLGAMSGEAPVRVLCDGSLAWFQLGDVEFSVRRVESSFPSYERILNPGSTTSAVLKKDALLAALDRVDVIVRSYTRMAVMQFSPGGQLKLTGRAPEFGTAIEFLDAAIDGESLRTGFNVGFLQDGLKSLGAEDIRMNLNGEAGQMTLLREGSDDFLYMLMPMRVADQDLTDFEEDEGLETIKDENAENKEPDAALSALLELKKGTELKEDMEISEISDADPKGPLPF
jgi:DNA polymerase-3 subunit beta